MQIHIERAKFLDLLVAAWKADLLWPNLRQVEWLLDCVLWEGDDYVTLLLPK